MFIEYYPAVAVNSCSRPNSSSYLDTVQSRGVPIWEIWVLPIPIIFLLKSTDTDHQSDIGLAYVKQ